MSFLETLPAVVRILIVFVLVLAAIRKKLSLGNAFLGGSVLLGFMFGLNPADVAKSAFFSLIHPKTLSLSIVVTLILVLSHSLESAGQMERLLNHFKGVVRHAGFNVVVFPALIGLLPMPGGAIFSAPMVKNLGEKYRLTGPQLSYVNYWFRHVWEYWWPLYPGVLLTTAISGIDLWVFVVCLFPMTLVAVIAGYLPIGGNIKAAGDEGPRSERTAMMPFLRELTPILIAIVLGLSLGTLLTVPFRRLGLTIAKETGLIVALGVSIAWVWHRNRMPGRDRAQIVFNKELLKMFYMVSAILIFQGILTDSQAVSQVSREMVRWHIPLIPISVLLPFLVGGVVGITIGFVGTTFPILISLIHTLGQGHLMLPYMMLAMTGGFMGVLFSPLHLCFLLSNAYFNTSLIPVYRYLWFPCSALLGIGFAYFWILRTILSG